MLQKTELGTFFYAKHNIGLRVNWLKTVRRRQTKIIIHLSITKDHLADVSAYGTDIMRQLYR